jgi:hypothetical protein
MQQASQQQRLSQSGGVPKLTEEQVQRVLANPQISLRAFARELKVSVTLIQRARRRQTYKHVQGTNAS